MNLQPTHCIPPCTTGTVVELVCLFTTTCGGGVHTGNPQSLRKCRLENHIVDLQSLNGWNIEYGIWEGELI